MPRKCKIQLRTLKLVPMNLRQSFGIIYLLVVEGIESNPGSKTGSTQGYRSPRGGWRGRGGGCNGRGSQQDPILFSVLLNL